MNLINATILKQNMSILSNWVDSTPVPDVIDSVTYDLYESSNPFRKTFSKEEISNRGLRVAANTTTAVGAEVFSAFANPFYLSHKLVSIPTMYTTVVDSYKRNSTQY